MKAYLCALTSAAAGLLAVNALPLEVNSTGMSLQIMSSLSLDLTNHEESIRNASATIAYGLMSWYTNNQSTTAPTAVGTMPEPLYWWEAGAVWGGMVDYWVIYCPLYLV